MKALQILYFLAGILFIAFSSWSHGDAAFIAKALLMPLLMLYYHLDVRGRYTLLHVLVMTGLLFSWFGDVLLQVPAGKWGISHLRDQLFMAGLGTFLVTQLLYTVAFILPERLSVMRAKGYSVTRPMESSVNQPESSSATRPNSFSVILSKESKQSEKAAGFFLLFIVAGYGGLLYWILYDGLGVMKVPVAAYTIVIIAMLLAALNRFGKVNRTSFLLVMAGAALFVLSDSLIAINRFHTKLDYSTLSVMSTYVLAQYLIVRGCLREGGNEIRQPTVSER